MYSIEDVDSITLLNYNYEVDENAFQYGEFTVVNIIGGSPVINKRAFSSCEDLTSIVFTDSILETEEYAFYSCEDLKSVTICENAKSDNEIKIDDRAFQYCKRLETVNVGNGNTEIGKTVFSGYAKNLIITIAGENYTAETIKDGLKQK